MKVVAKPPRRPDPRFRVQVLGRRQPGRIAQVEAQPT
jgi:hypothetical protein